MNELKPLNKTQHEIICDLQAENARLTAALVRIAVFPIHSEPVGAAYTMSDIANTALKGNSTTLRDLLTPLADKLQTARLSGTSGFYAVQQVELSLRELCGEKGPAK